MLNINELYAIIGGSLGGGIGWEMLGLNNTLAQNFIPVATDWKTSDWLYAQCLVQDFYLHNPISLYKSTYSCDALLQNTAIFK